MQRQQQALRNYYSSKKEMSQRQINKRIKLNKRRSSAAIFLFDGGSEMALK